MQHDEFLEALRALAEPTRLRLIALLAESELTVSEMVEILGQSQPRLSRHLKLLSDAGLLDRSPEGVHVYFRLAGDEAAGRLARALLASFDADDPLRALDRQRLEAIRHSRAVSAESYFQRHAAEWDAIRSLHIQEGEVERAIQKLLPKRKMRDLLDLGTGTGRMLQLCAGSVERAVGIDTSREMLAVARANLDGQAYRNCSLRRAPAERLPFGNASFDVVLSHMVLHFLPDPELVIREAARVMRPRGRLILVDFAPHDATVLGPDHAHRWPGFSDERVNRWIEGAGLVVGRPVSLPAPSGLSHRPLTVKLWRGEQPEPVEPYQPTNRADPNLELFQ